MLWRAVMSGAGPAPWWGLDLLSHATSSSGCSEPAGVWSYRLRMLLIAGGYGCYPTLRYAAVDSWPQAAGSQGRDCVAA